MATEFQRRFAALGQADAAVVDEGLRAYMLRVYNIMASGVALSGIVAYLVATTPFLAQLVYGNAIMHWVVILSPLGLVILLSARIHRMSAFAAQATFWVFAGLMGASLSWVFLVYTDVSIVRVFFITAATFAGMSLYGYTTKKSLASWGSFLFMGLIGIIIASVVNIFLASSALQFAISVIGVLIFVGLTAYDTQMIKQSYYASDSQAVQSKKAIMGALRLYLDFINLFLMMLRLFGQHR